jgi:protein ImuA
VEADFASDRALILLKKRMILSPNRSHFGGSCAARTSTLATLRGSIERIESHGDAYTPGRVALGHADADATLQGGLAVGAMHEVFADAGRQSAAATGFVAGLAGRAAARRPLVWVRQDFTEIESGALSMSGWAELGLDPRLLVTVRAADVDAALRTAADALACDALGAVVLEVWGEARQLDLVASRKLTLAAQASGVTGLLLRLAAEPQPSTAETRWIMRAAHSPPAGPLMPVAPLMPAAPWSVWGAPVFDAQLVRNRHGPVGRWIMEWKCDECLFSKPAAYPQPVAAAPAHRPHQAPARARQRRVS